VGAPRSVLSPVYSGDLTRKMRKKSTEVPGWRRPGSTTDGPGLSCAFRVLEPGISSMKPLADEFDQAERGRSMLGGGGWGGGGGPGRLLIHGKGCSIAPTTCRAKAGCSMEIGGKTTCGQRRGGRVVAFIFFRLAGPKGEFRRPDTTPHGGVSGIATLKIGRLPLRGGRAPGLQGQFI